MIDRYLTRQFIRVFVMTFVSLLGVFIIGEFVTNFSEFMEYRDSTTNFGQAIAAYYGARFPMFFDLAGHIVALLAAVLVVSWLQRSNELTALQAAGISRLRVVRPLLIITAVIAVLGVLNREYLIPSVRHLLVNDIRDIVQERSETLTPHYDNASNILFDGDSVTSRAGTIENPRIRLPFAWESVGYSLRAEAAEYHEATDQRPAGYLLRNVEADLQTAGSVISENGETMIFAATDYGWLEPNQCFIASALKPSVLRGNHRWLQYASTPQLIESLRDSSTYHTPSTEITLHSRFVRPFLDMSLVLFGLPIALASQRRHVFSGAAKSILVVAAFALVTVGCQALGAQTLVTPAMAAWLPLLILGPAAVLFSGQLTA